LENDNIESDKDKILRIEKELKQAKLELEILSKKSNEAK